MQSVEIIINLTPLNPPLLSRRGGEVLKEGLTPLSDTPLVYPSKEEERFLERSEAPSLTCTPHFLNKQTPKSGVYRESP